MRLATVVTPHGPRVVAQVGDHYVDLHATDPGLHGLELGRGLLNAAGGFLNGDRKSRHPFVCRLDPGSHRVDLTGQPGQPLAAVRLGACRGEVCSLGLRRDALALAQFSAGFFLTFS